MTHFVTEALDLCRSAAVAAAQEALQTWDQQHITTRKGRADFFTEVDLAAERQIVAAIQERFPDHGILTEEVLSQNTDAPFLWVIDPIDGTMNYISGLPFFSVSVALLHHGRPLVGVVVDPYHNEVFHAVRDQGAFCNQEPIHVSQQQELSQCSLGTELHHSPHNVRHPVLQPGFTGSVGNVRMLGSTCLGLAYAACGRLDMAFYLNANPWDIAAGSLLVQEAGGLTVDWEGCYQPLQKGDLLAGPRPLVEALQAAFHPGA